MASTLKEPQFNQEAITVGKKRQLFNDDFVIARQEGLHRQRHKMSGFTRLTYNDQNKASVSDTASQFGWVLGVIESEQLTTTLCPTRFISWKMCSPLALPNEFFVCIYGSEDSIAWFPLPVPDTQPPGTNVVLASVSFPTCRQSQLVL